MGKKMEARQGQILNAGQQMVKLKMWLMVAQMVEHLCIYSSYFVRVPHNHRRFFLNRQYFMRAVSMIWNIHKCMQTPLSLGSLISMTIATHLFCFSSLEVGIDN